MKHKVSVRAVELDSFGREMLDAWGCDPRQAGSVIENLVWSELVGRANFGFLRLPLYLDRIAAGGITVPCRPRFEDRSASISLLDGANGFGQYAGALAMERAVAMARRNGTGLVGVRNSNFFGTGAWFVHMAADAGMVSLAMSNSFPKVAAYGGRLPVFGTNPFAFGAPRRDGRSIMFDMATSGLAGSTVRQHMTSGEPLPAGLAIARDGSPITDPARVAEGALLPFGGAKGYGLALMVEILAGVLTGAGVSSAVGSMYKELARGGDNGHLMLAIDISRFMPLETYYDRLEGLIDAIKASGGGDQVLIPGEARWKAKAANRTRTVVLPAALASDLASRAMVAAVAVPWQSEPMAA